MHCPDRWKTLNDVAKTGSLDRTVHLFSLYLSKKSGCSAFYRKGQRKFLFDWLCAFSRYRNCLIHESDDLFLGILLPLRWICRIDPLYLFLSDGKKCQEYPALFLPCPDSDFSTRCCLWYSAVL